MAEGLARESRPILVHVSHSTRVSGLPFLSLVPVIANGFDDLRQRVEAQTQQSAAHTAGIKVRHFAVRQQHLNSTIRRNYKTSSRRFHQSTRQRKPIMKYMTKSFLPL